ncbi:ankyrin repeat-containing domain protein [Neocallimastix sp. 'constans']
MTYIIYLHKQPNIVILNIKSLNGLSVTLKGFLKQHAENLSSSQSKELTKLFKGIKENQILKKYVILLREMQIFIIENGENINHKNVNGNTALIIACANGHDEIVKLLLNVYNKHLKMFNKNTNTNKKVVKLLVSNLANVNIKNSNGTPLMLATKHNFFRYCYFDIMKYLIEHGVDINNSKNKQEYQK